jgi:hypothetical protein
MGEPVEDGRMERLGLDQPVEQLGLQPVEQLPGDCVAQCVGAAAEISLSLFLVEDRQVGGRVPAVEDEPLSGAGPSGGH